MIAQGLRWTVVGVCCAALVGPAALADDRDRDRDADHPLARSHEGRRGEPERPGESPKVAVIRLEHIPAVSFMETIKQLAQAEEAREHLKRIPLAMNEQANAIVVVGPPEVCEFFERIAEGLDKPSEFHARMRERQMDEARRGMELREQMARRCMELRQEMQ